MSALPKLYDDVVMDHIKNVRNYREMEAADLQARGVNRLCGDDLTLSLKAAAGRITEAAFQCECCGISMASASIMTEVIAGAAPTEALALAEAVQRAAHDQGRPPEVGDVGTIVAVARAYPARRRCALLPWVTLVAALSGRSEAQT